MKITVRYQSIDRVNVARSFATMKGAQAFAARYVGATPEISKAYQYAVSADGIGRVTCNGCDITALFPEVTAEPVVKRWECPSLYTCQKRWNHPDACDFCTRNPGCEGAENDTREPEDTCYFCGGSGEQCGDRICCHCDGTGKTAVPFTEHWPPAVPPEDDGIPF